MEEYFLPVTIRPDNRKNWRIHYANLSKRGENKTKRNYIIAYPVKKHVYDMPLFSIRIESYQLISAQKADANVSLQELHFLFQYDDTKKTLQVILSKQPGTNNTGSTFLFVKNEAEVTVSRAETTYRGVLHIELIYKEGDKTFSDAFSITTIDGNCYYHAGIDFGSEASQMKYLPPFEVPNPNIAESVDIIRRLEEEIGADLRTPGKKDRTFWQTDSPGNTDLYRSIFPLNEELINDYHQDVPFTIADLSKDIHLLEDLLVVHPSGRLLPNLKLFKLLTNCAFGNQFWNQISFKYKEADIKLVYIYSAIRKQLIIMLIRLLLQSILKDLTGNHTGQTIGINLKLLAPNIYSHEEVHEMVDMVYCHFDQIKKQVLPADSQMDIAVEASVIAESEAAIIKEIKMDQTNRFSNATVLTIDGGKGTMDISVCFVKSEHDEKHILSLYRSGFAGAGDLITYGFFEYFITRINQAMEREQLMKEIDRLIDEILLACPDPILRVQYETKIKKQTSPGVKMLAIRTFINLAPSENEHTLQLISKCDAWEAGKIDDRIIKRRIRELNYHQKLQLMNFFDKMKKDSGSSDCKILNNSFYQEVFKTLKDDSLDAFITLLGRQEKCMIHCESYDDLPEEIRKRVDSIIDSIIEKLTSVGFFNPEEPQNKIDLAIYSGRCFLFHPLAKQLEKRLLEKTTEFEKQCSVNQDKKGFLRKVIDAMNPLNVKEVESKRGFEFLYLDTSIYDDNYYKYASITGAIIKDAGINNGSELSGILFSDSVIKHIRLNPKLYERRLFYEGIPIIHEGKRKNSTSVRLNGYTMPNNFNRDSDAIGFFVGKGFLIQFRDHKGREQAGLTEWDFWKNDTNTNEKLYRMLQESFFPFNI